MSSAATPIPRATTAEILARLEAELGALPGSPGGLLASDADGTIWDGDVGIELFEALLAAGGVRAAAREALAAEARGIGLAAEGDGNALAAALYEAYKADRYAHDRAFAMMAWVFAGYRQDELAAFCAGVLRQGDLGARIRPEMRAIFAWAASHGVPVYVVSASPRAIVEVAVTHLGIAADHVAAMTPALAPEGVLLPELAGPIVYGEGKLVALERAVGSSLPLLGAFGDSAYDAAMMRVARVPVAVTPAPGLVAVASSIPGLVMLAR